MRNEKTTFWGHLLVSHPRWLRYASLADGGGSPFPCFPFPISPFSTLCTPRTPPFSTTHLTYLTHHLPEPRTAKQTLLRPRNLTAESSRPALPGVSPSSTKSKPRRGLLPRRFRRFCRFRQPVPRRILPVRGVSRGLAIVASVAFVACAISPLAHPLLGRAKRE
jgi:hypothetical protein